jgi:hypothetical protein
MLEPAKPHKYVDCAKECFISEKEMKHLLEDLQKNRGDVPTNPWLYKVASECSSSGHRHGDGGESETHVFLQKGDTPVLLSVHYSSYYTYCDDSFDFPGGKSFSTYLLIEDPLGRIIFERCCRYGEAAKV